MESPHFFVGLGSRVPPAPGALTARLPVAKNADGTSVVAKSREEYYDPPFNMPGKDNMFIKYLTYPAATLDKTQATLTMRAHEKDNNRVPITDWEYVDEWTFQVCPNRPVPIRGPSMSLSIPPRTPLSMVWDLPLFVMLSPFCVIRVRTTRVTPIPYRRANSKDRSQIKKALAYGASQTGRIIKTFVVEGFNEDEKGKMVFDGINSHIGASRKNWLNGQFSHPGDIFGNDQFPFTYARTTDHFTGVTGSNLDQV